MAAALPVRRSGRSTLLRALALAAVLAAALLAMMNAGLARLPLPMERSSFTGGGGYWLLGKDGGVFAYGDAKYYGANRNQGKDIAGMAATATGNGYWTVDDDGDVFAYGDAVDYGSRPGPEVDDIVGFAARSQGDGYWMVAKDGAVYAFGGARYFGSANTVKLTKAIVGMAATPSGKGYWLIAGDGGVFAYGDAAFFGSTGNIKLNKPIVDFGPSSSGDGYRFIGNDGGVFAYGDAKFYGSTGALTLNMPIVGFASTATGKGYWLVGEDGGVFAFGDAKFYGGTGGVKLNAPIVAIVATPRIKVPPVAKDDAATVAEDGSVTVDVAANDTHALPVSVSVQSSPGHGSAVVAGGKITYTPSANYHGLDGFLYSVTDTAGHSATGSVIVTVTSVNDAPTAAATAGSIAEDGHFDGSVSAVDVESDALTYSKVEDAAHGSVTVNANGTFTYTPGPDYNGSDSFTFKANDGKADSNTATVTITVTAVNDAPVATPDSDSTDEDVNLNGQLAGTDVETDAAALTFAKASEPTHGSVIVNADGSFTYDPADNYNGPDSFTFTANDGTTDSAAATFSITVNSVNDAPTISDVGAQVIVEGHSLSGLEFTVEDVDGDTISISGTSDNHSLVLDAGIGGTVVGDTATVTVTPLLGQDGTAEITVIVSDGTATASDTFTLTVQPDEQPVANDDLLIVADLLSVDIDVLGNDTGTGNGPLTVTIESGLDPVTEGAVIIGEDGTIHLDSVLGALSVTFDYRVTDADGDFDTGTVTVIAI